MSWMEGTGPVKDVGAHGISKGLSKDWYSEDSTHKNNRKEILKSDFWDVIDNPLFEVAAGALGHDWGDWIKDAKGKVGTSPNDGSTIVYAIVSPGMQSLHQLAGLAPKSPNEYKQMTMDEAIAKGLDYEPAKTTRFQNKKTGEIVNELIPAWDLGSTRNQATLELLYGGTKSISDPDRARVRTEAARLFGDDWKKGFTELRDWGVTDNTVAEELDKMSGWLSDVVNVNDHLHPIIREGPKGEHYGIEGDIWEHYGLDKDPEPPKELDWDSYDKKMQLKKTVKSTVTYSTPHGIKPVDLHGD